MNVLVMGYSTRSFAEQVYLDGHNVYSIDFFGDTDYLYFLQTEQKMRAYWRCSTGLKKLEGSHDLSVMLRIANELDFRADAVVYTSNFENHPEFIEELEKMAGVRLLANSSDTARTVLNSYHTEGDGNIFKQLKQQEIGVPESSACLQTLRESIGRKKRILRKPYLSGGGYRIHRVKTGAREPVRKEIGKTSGWAERSVPEYYYQEYLDGRSCSAAFVADGESATLIGISEQLIGERKLGARGFKYCGNLRIDVSTEQWNEVEKIAGSLTKMFSLKGLNGFDFIFRDGRTFFIELNPRYTASMELYADGLKESLFSLHRKAFDGKMPPLESGVGAVSGFRGKGIVYARENLIIGAEIVPFLREHFAGYGEDFVLKDIPEAEEEVERNKPLCSILVRTGEREDMLKLFGHVQDALYKNVLVPCPRTRGDVLGRN